MDGFVATRGLQPPPRTCLPLPCLGARAPSRTFPLLPSSLASTDHAHHSAELREKMYKRHRAEVGVICTASGKLSFGSTKRTAAQCVGADPDFREIF